MVDLLHWKNSFELTSVLKVVKSVNLMNKLLVNGEIKNTVPVKQREISEESSV